MNAPVDRQQLGIETEALIHRCQRGDKLAIEALIRRYQNYVYRLCCLVMRNEQDAEDMTQETFIRACRALPRFEIREGISFEAWLYRISINCCRSRMRRKWYQVLPWPEPAPQLTAAADDRPDRVIEQDERRSVILDAVHKLNEKHRLVVILRYYSGLSNEEIARTLDIPSGTVRSRLYTARQRLKALLGDREDQESQMFTSQRLAR